MKSLYEYSDVNIALIVIGGGLLLALTLCLGLCGILHTVKRHRRRSSSNSNYHYGKNGLIKEQSQSVVRGDHPIAFMLPTVSLSEPGSEISDLESLTPYSTSSSITLFSGSPGYPSWRRIRNLPPAHQTVHRHHRHLSQPTPVHSGAWPIHHSAIHPQQHLKRATRRKYLSLMPEDSGDFSRYLGGSESSSPAGFAGFDSDTELLQLRQTKGKRAKSKSLPVSPRIRSHRSHQSQHTSRLGPGDVIRESLLEASGQAADLPKVIVPDDDLEEDFDATLQTSASPLLQGRKPIKSFGGTEDRQQLKKIDEWEQHQPELGKIKTKFSVNSDNHIMISEIYLTDLDSSRLRSNRVSVRIRLYPEYEEALETGTMSVFEDKVLLLDPLELTIVNLQSSPNYVLKISIMDKTRSAHLPSRIKSKIEKTPQEQDQTSSTQEASHLTRDTAAGEQALLEEGQSRPEEKDIPEESEIFPLEENPAKVEEDDASEKAPKEAATTTRSSESMEEESVPRSQLVTSYGHYSGTTYGQCIFNLRSILPIRDGSAWMEASIKKSVSEELAEIFSDALEISLCYEPENGKLILGIIQAKLSGSTSLIDPEAFLYAKVTLFEGRRVIKAKKTRPVGLCAHPQFHETFSILFPEHYLDRVSCVISLCTRNRQGTKYVLGRLCVGPPSYAHKMRGLQHWARMTQNSGATIIQWHPLL